jgi:hypothetical protein
MKTSEWISTKNRNVVKRGINMYGFIGLLDCETENVIKEIWKELSSKSISFYAEEINDRKPHITIASYNNLEKNEFIHSMDRFYNSKPQVKSPFSILGTFMKSGTLFLSPINSRPLLDFHTNHHEHFKKYNDNRNSLYLPGKWIPHCTLANRLTNEKLSEAFAYCSERISTINARITEVSLIEVIYEEGKCVASYELISKRLI